LLIFEGTTQGDVLIFCFWNYAWDAQKSGLKFLAWGKTHTH